MRKKKIMPFVMVAALMLSVSGCGSSSSNPAEQTTADLPTKEIRQNDYRGGVVRTQGIQKAVLDKIEQIKSGNAVIRSENPNTYWSNTDYQDFVLNFLNSQILTDTQWFNEEEASWSETLQVIGRNNNSFTEYTNENDYGYKLKSGIKITRNEKDDYSVSGISKYYSLFTSEQALNYRILYDCDKDWCKAYANINIGINGFSPVTMELYEYRRITDDIYVIQTNTERVLAIYEPAEKDTDLRDRVLSEFYYSRLATGGYRTSFKPSEYLNEYDTNSAVIQSNVRMNDSIEAYYGICNTDGDNSRTYGVNDSVFYMDFPVSQGALKEDFKAQFINDWIYADNSMQQAIWLKDGILCVVTWNKLSNVYETFTYSPTGTAESMIKSVSDTVETDTFVGTKYRIPYLSRSEGTKPSGQTVAPIQDIDGVKMNDSGVYVDDDGETLSFEVLEEKGLLQEMDGDLYLIVGRDMYGDFVLSETPIETEEETGTETETELEDSVIKTPEPDYEETEEETVKETKPAQTEKKGTK